MELYLIRHGIAEDPVDAALARRNDAARLLTPEGREKTAKVARGLERRLGQVDLILHSPFTRARETADILAAEFPSARREELGCFRPQDNPAESAAALAAHASLGRVIAVGHEPHLSDLLSLLLIGRAGVEVAFKKAAVAGLVWGGTGASQLLCFVPSRFF